MVIMKYEREKLVERFQEMKRSRVPIIGGGAGTGISAKSEEAGGIDLIVIYNSGRYGWQVAVQLPGYRHSAMPTKSLLRWRAK